MNRAAKSRSLSIMSHWAQSFFC